MGKRGRHMRPNRARLKTPLWLDELETGAAVRFTDKYGEVYGYEIYEIQTIAPDAVAALDNYEGDHGLGLITCTEDGKDRLLVKCRMTSEIG